MLLQGSSLASDGKHRGCGSNGIPFWLISADSRFCEDIAEYLTKVNSFSFRGSFCRWQLAIPELRKHFSMSPRIVLIDEDPKTQDGAACLSFLRDAVPEFSMIVLMNDACDENLLSALSHGVSGFLLKPIATDEIAAAMETVVRGEVWMKRSVLDRIVSLIPRIESMRPPSLTNRELEIVNLVLGGLSTKEIADRLNISYFTVDTHFKNIYQKLKVNNRSSLVSLVLHNRIL